MLPCCSLYNVSTFNEGLEISSGPYLWSIFDAESSKALGITFAVTSVFAIFMLSTPQQLTAHVGNI